MTFTSKAVLYKACSEDFDLNAKPNNPKPEIKKLINKKHKPFIGDIIDMI